MVAVSEADPLPDALVTIPQLMLMPALAFESLQEDGDGDGAFLLDASALEDTADEGDDDEFRTIVLRALSLALERRVERIAGDAADAALLATSPRGGGYDNSRRRMACCLRVAERRAVLAAQRAVSALSAQAAEATRSAQRPGNPPSKRARIE